MSNHRNSSSESSAESIRVSPRHLGQMRRADFCPYCFWYSIALGFRHPWDMPMPGIMYNMDGFEKRIVDAHFQAKSALPKWLTSLGCVEPVSFPRKMTQEYPELGLTLVGMPDAVFSKEDGSLCVVDYKTAKCKGADDPFMPGYEVQLWGYAQLLEHNQIGTVSSAAIVYFENTLADYGEKSLDLLTTNGLQVPFGVKIHPVDLDLDELNSLLKTFREYAYMPEPPNGGENCKTCQRLERLFAIKQGLRAKEGTIGALQDSDRVFLHSQMRKWASYQRIDRALESLGWEKDLEDGLSSGVELGPVDWVH
jgi:hypothetical protein